MNLDFQKSNKRSFAQDAIKMAIMVVGIGGMMAMTGCSKATSTAEARKTPRQAATPANNPGQRIVGQWLGTPQIDENALKDVLATTIDDDEKESILNMVESFKSVTVGAVFGADKSLQLEVEFALQGAPSERESSVGTWKLIDETEQYLIVETIEHNDDQPNIQQVRYDFLGDENTIAMEAPTNKVLRQFSPRIVFERRRATNAASQETKLR